MSALVEALIFELLLFSPAICYVIFILARYFCQRVRKKRGDDYVYGERT